MAKKNKHSWNEAECIIWIEYYLKYWNRRDLKLVYEECAELVNSQMVEGNNPTTSSSIAMGANHIKCYLNDDKRNFGQGPLHLVSAVDKIMKDREWNKSMMLRPFE